MIWTLLAVAWAAEPTLTIHTEDAERFFDAVEGAEALGYRRALKEGYVKPGTDGLHAFARREFRVGALASQVKAARPFYDHLAGEFAAWPSIEPVVLEAYRQLVLLYPETRAAPVYLVVGQFSSGGFIADEGVLIGLELFGRTPDLDTEGWPQWLRDGMRPMRDLAPIIIHELVHWQQNWEGDSDRLGQVIREGTADFVAEQVCGRHTNPVQREYGLAHEAEIWTEFYPDRHDARVGKWLYAMSADPAVPKDLGYFVGYRIAQALYERSDDKHGALVTLMTFDDGEALLLESGYGR